jgi:predicted AlkP superfamily pyrophosphatase or phosphodiesterase
MTFTIICLDGFRYDYLEKTEFLKRLAKTNLHGKLSPGMGYSSEISALTGKNAEELGILANNFIYNPRKLRFFHFFKAVDKFPLKNQLRLLLELIYNLKEFATGNCQPKSIFKIPLQEICYFDFLLKKNFFTENLISFSTIFDFFRKKNKKVSGYIWPFIYRNNAAKLDIFNLKLNTGNTDERAFRKSVALLKENPDILYVHFFSADNLVHKYGTNSEETFFLIRKLDSYVKAIAAFSDKLLVFSDHGMVDVKESFDVMKEIRKTPFILGKDYIMFLDSAMARFWFFNKECGTAFRKFLADSGKGKFVTFRNEE